MLRLRVCLLGALAASTLAGSIAHGQVFIGRRPGGIVVRAPFAPPVRIGIGIGVAPVRPYLLPRRRFFGGPYYGAASAYPVPAVVGAAPSNESPSLSAPSSYTAARPSLPTDAALRAMDDSALLNATLDATRMLDDDLARFNTGSQWQSYLRLPGDALPPPADNQVTLGFGSLKQTVARFDTVAANSDYGMISELPSFDASRSALAEVVRRFGSRRGDAASRAADPVAEELPAPAAATAAVAPASYEAPAARSVATPGQSPTLAAPANAPEGEQSILVK